MSVTARYQYKWVRHITQTPDVCVPTTSYYAREDEWDEEELEYIQVVELGYMFDSTEDALCSVQSILEKYPHIRFEELRLETRLVIR